MDIRQKMIELAKECKEASYTLQKVGEKEKNSALEFMKEELEKNTERILEENAKDVEKAKEKGLSTALIDRLKLNEKRIKSMIKGIEDVIKLPDPVGEIVKMWRRPNGLLIGKMRVPIGVIGIIYEARPNVTSDAAVLCLKSGNCVILRGGSEAFNSNFAIVDCLKKGLEKAGLPPSCIQFVPFTEREAVSVMLRLNEYIDLIIPRGGEGLIRKVTEEATIPVIKHYKGVCHVYVDEFADLDMALKIALNAKIQRPGVCNAMETLLVHEKVAENFLPRLKEEMEKAGVELRGCERTKKILPEIKPATEEDWYTEYLDLILSIKVVKDLEEAIHHINFYGSHHSDAIVTRDYRNGWRFLNEVDSAAVYVNASTRFTDGGEFGMGAEIGISTDKLHARGPMALEELTTTKFIILGDGQIRE
ncbi:glutamate-5-semialdehyde dehydrogenase [Candidatus Calescamantes bacterium]|nr:glutamate-5-semialdehyde dehydrogenase [Candidatus Calescamantes bacterium]